MIVDVAFRFSAASDVEHNVAIVVDALRESARIVAVFEAGAGSVVELAASERRFGARSAYHD